MNEKKYNELLTKLRERFSNEIVKKEIEENKSLPTLLILSYAINDIDYIIEIEKEYLRRNRYFDTQDELDEEAKRIILDRATNIEKLKEQNKVIIQYMTTFYPETETFDNLLDKLSTIQGDVFCSYVKSSYRINEFNKYENEIKEIINDFEF